MKKSLASYWLVVSPLAMGCSPSSDTDTDTNTATATGTDTAVCEAAEPCSGDYIIENEGDLEEIYLCDSISGDLEFDEQDWLTSIDLPCPTTVGGYLNISSNDALTSLDGLESVTTVGGALGIGHNDALTSIDGLSSLTTVGDDLDIHGNDALTSLDGLESLTTVGVQSREGRCRSVRRVDRRRWLDQRARQPR